MKRDNKGKTIRNTVRRTALSLALSVALASTCVPLAAAEEIGKQAASGQITGEVALESSSAAEQGPAATLPGQLSAEAPLSKDGAKATFGTVSFEGLEYSVNPDGATATLTGFSDGAEGDVAVPSEITSGGDTYLVTSVNIFGGGSFLR